MTESSATSDTSPMADPFLLDLEQLRALASDGVVRRGVQYFKEQRVVDIGWTQERLWASVAGSQLEPYQVEANLDTDKEALFSCSCPFEEEAICKHAVAAALAYGARQAIPETRFQSASEQAIGARRQAAQTEVLVKHSSGEPGFGTWEARSVISTGAALRPYKVVIRSVKEQLNTCSCPDFAVNRLGTCKHIEAVLLKLARRHATKAKAAEQVAVVYLAWVASNQSRVRVKRPRLLPEAAAQLVDLHFDEAGWLKAPLPDGWFRLEADCAGMEFISLGDDAADHAKKLAEDAMHRDRAERIRHEIGRAGRQLPGIRATLFPYQVDGVAFLAGNGRALLADDMGLGKTLQSIAAAAWLVEREGVQRVLVVCPASLKRQWAREITRFTGRDAAVVEGDAAARLRAYRSEATFLVVNYEIVLRDQSLLVERFAPELLILDEAQRIKNWRSKTAAVLKSLPARYVFVLTGTPIENRLHDLYSLMQRVDPRVLGPLWRFELEFHVTDDRGQVIGYRNLGELRRRLAPVMLRRDRKLVADQLPDRTEVTIDTPLTARQQELHDGALQTAANIASTAQRRPLTPPEIQRLLSALQIARMACNAAGLVDKETVGSPKLDELAKLLESLCQDEGRKVVVFSQWERMTAMAAEVCQNLGIGHVSLHGGVPSANRQSLVDRFAQEPDVNVFLSTDAGATGLNLQCASALIILDLPWNPAILDQRIARIHRLGQREKVLIIKLVAAESYEQRIAGLIESKRQLFGAAVHQGEEDSQSDVVGVSKRTLEFALQSLDDLPVPAKTSAEAGQEQPTTGSESADLPEVPGPEPEVESTESAPPAVAKPDVPVPLDPVMRAVEALTRLLAGNLERVLVARGTVVALVERMDAAALTAGEAIGFAAGLDVAVVDQRTWTILQRMQGGGSSGQVEERWARAAAGA